MVFVEGMNEMTDQQYGNQSRHYLHRPPDAAGTPLHFESLSGTAERSTPSIVNKAKLDLVVLQYMARRVNMALTLHYQAADAAGPLLYYAKERRKRTHRIAIYQPDELFQNTDIAFVGFISGKRLSTSPAVIDELHAIDTKMIVELMNTPGILSYSSLELRDGNWCNLVLLSDLDAKIHVKNSDTHKYAAYDLAPHYYEWIRLHLSLIHI